MNPIYRSTVIGAVRARSRSYGLSRARCERTFDGMRRYRDLVHGLSSPSIEGNPRRPECSTIRRGLALPDGESGIGSRSGPRFVQDSSALGWGSGGEVIDATAVVASRK